MRSGDGRGMSAGMSVPSDGETARTSEDTSQPAWFATEPLALAEGVEVLETDAGTLVHHPRTGKFTRITPTGARLLQLLDGERSAAAVVACVAGDDSEKVDKITPVVQKFLQQLLDSGMLNISPEQEAPRRGPRRVGLMFRIPLVHDLEGVADAIARPLRRIPAGALVAAWGLLLAGSAVLVVIALSLPPPDRSEVFWPALFGALFLIVVHEGAHAVACRYYQLRVPEAGLALWGFLLPMAYVDRTDSYRLDSRKQRAVVSLVGPGIDIIHGGIAAAVAIGASGTVGGTARIFVLFALFALFVNLNPLMASDGAQSVETLVGSLNGRQRAFRYTLSLIKRERASAAVGEWSPLARAGAVAYTLMSVAYFLAVGAVLVFMATAPWRLAT